MQTIAVTGPRQLTAHQRTKALSDLQRLKIYPNWLVGDASGLDKLARSIGQTHHLNLQIYEKRSELPHRAQGVERSTRMIKALATAVGTLHAWPNKPAPHQLIPSRSWPTGAAGSGTWGTIALAVGLGIPVKLHPLAEIDIPSWLQSEQLTLL
ncbi:hypothetical protein [Acaryochloris marina]|uniref:Uncharacterized protein n=1 Tax=Acaryochloris marina (strain MBIC 11017) TaxID=329726 RepID=B0C6F3_ACAM1|nr:hypothetical protein [Acaryochloris marina]ABW26374.1 hypothetical protein AM1_1340 [Acaryochloris marina MBIC11017]BDM81190.1 hypothetical protein AM10699_40570 [Acaryochloris marina MBIC10699]